MIRGECRETSQKGYAIPKEKTETGVKLYVVLRLAKWAKDKIQSAREVPKMPILHFNGQTANTFEEKTDMLKSTFFPSPPQADLSDIAGSFYPALIQCPVTISKSEITEALQRLKADKAPGPDGISKQSIRIYHGKKDHLPSRSTPPLT